MGQETADIGRDPEPIKVGEEIEEVSMPESVAHEAWCGWKECLKMAHRQWRIGAVALQGKLLLEPLVHVKKMTEEEWNQFKGG